MDGLWQHQEDAIAWAFPRRAALLHHGMGAGKSRTALEIIKRHGGTRVLVCCPVAVIPAWIKQAGLWAPGYRVLALTKGTSALKCKQVAAAVADLTPLIVVVNYETAHRMAVLSSIKWDVIVWDEVHRLKSPSGVASRWAAKMCKTNPVAKVLGLSGTLIPHSILDAWAVYRAVEAPECPTFGQSFTLHRANYAVMNPHVRGMVVRWQNLERAQAKIAATTHRVRSEDVLDLPPIQFLDVPVELTPAEASLYREIEREFCAVCEQGTVTPSNALVQLLRLQQLCGGYVRFDDTAAAKKIDEHPSKAARLADMLEDLPADEPLVTFCRFRSDIDSVLDACRRTGRTVSELSGAKNELADWQYGATSTLVAQIQSGGIGIDLTRAAYCVFVSLGYSLEQYEQAVARLHRPGQTKRTLIYHLIATIGGRSTVDGRVYQALRERKEVVNDIIDGYRGAAAIGAR